MIVSTIIITVRYAPGVTMEEAEKDKAYFQHKINEQFLSSVSGKENLRVEHAITEIIDHSPEPDHIPHNHFGEVFRPDTCPACAAMKKD